MRIYVDYDDCLCETARAFTVIAERLFGKQVPYEQVRFFQLKESFDLTEEEYERLMIEGHRPEVLLSYEETPGASRVVNEWIDQGNEVFIITGRPYSTWEASRLWLDRHGLERARLFFLNKYGRDSFIKKDDFNLELEDYYQMKFDYAVEDSPHAFHFFDHLPELKVMVYDRPWNRECVLPNRQYSRCTDWEAIRKKVNDKRETLVHPIPPVYDKDSRALILGSFPSVKSREEGFFYGHPQNRYWKVLAAVFGEKVPQTIEEKKAFLLQNHIAVWDVIRSCEIVGSSDASIRNVAANDLREILEKAQIRQIYVNGKTAEKMYKKYIMPTLQRECVCLPSTSPANAAWGLEKLVEAWSVVRS